VELQPFQHAARFASWKGLVEGTGRMRRQVVEDDPDPLDFRIVHVSEVSHTGGKVDASSAVGHFDSPGTVRVKEDE
jgi:hypothetical protein